jgi:hypothetical protein
MPLDVDERVKQKNIANTLNECLVKQEGEDIVEIHCDFPAILFEKMRGVILPDG